MSYQQLLNPKGFAKEKQKKKGPNYGPQQSRKPTNPPPAESKTSPQKFDPKALLAPKAGVGKMATTSPTTAAVEEQAPSPVTKIDNEDTQSGMADFIIRQNNLVNREASVPRKRKLNPDNDAAHEDEGESEDHKHAKSTFTGASAGGEIGKYLKAEREKGAAENGIENEPIDLTKDEDEGGDNDVVMLYENNQAEREVCLGMLHSQAIAWQIPAAYKHQTSKVGSDFWPETRVHYRRSPAQNSILELFSKTKEGVMSMKFGNMDGKLASVLCPLLDGNNINKMRLKIYLSAFAKRAGEFPGFRTSRSLRLRIIIYAPRMRAQVIGRQLSQRQIFLSKPPEFDLRGVEYDNPHEPKALGGPMKTIARNSSQASKATFVTRTQEEILRETSDMFDSLVKTENLPEKEANEALIITPLMAHQKQALHFLTAHERDSESSEDAESKFSLWKPHLKKSGQVWYNIITNHELPTKPEPSRGGILADVMGLGKTLSILALIADTKDEARTFGDQEADIEEMDVKRHSKATLIICPKSVMANWSEQIKAHTVTSEFKFYSYHGPNRTQDLEELAEYDIVLAPYQTVASEFSDTRAKRSALASIKWFRVVLDEAHMIRNPTTGVSKACCKLSAQRRWAVTGTPVQNRLDDLGALIKFLRIKPFDDSTTWSQYIIAPFRAASEHVIGHLRLLVDSITLRRMKDNIGLKGRVEHNERLTFSDEEWFIYNRFAQESNRQLRIMLQGENRLKGKSYAHVLKSLGRLRAICAHGQEMLSEEDRKELEGLTAGTAIELGDEPTPEPDESFISAQNAYDTFSMMMESEVNVCTSCGRKISDQKDGSDLNEDTEEDSSDDSSSGDEDEDNTLGYLTPCFHLLCPDCKDPYVDESRTNLTEDHYHVCVHCQQYVRWGLFELTRLGLKNMLDARANKNKKGNKAKWDELNYSGPHTKVKALLQDLDDSDRETATLPSTEPPIRSVVFSGWTTYLDLIEHALDERDIRYVRLDGKMSVKARTQVLATFNSDPTVTVLLVSIKAGGQGLNFTAASKVYMMEPQFNPGVEMQAIDRVHRLGQNRDVVIKHYIMKDSVEEKILLLQEKKNKLAKLSLERKISRSEEAKKKIEELRDLFK